VEEPACGLCRVSRRAPSASATGTLAHWHTWPCKLWPGAGTSLAGLGTHRWHRSASSVGLIDGLTPSSRRGRACRRLRELRHAERGLRPSTRASTMGTPQMRENTTAPVAEGRLGGGCRSRALARPRLRHTSAARGNRAARRNHEHLGLAVASRRPTRPVREYSTVLVRRMPVLAARAAADDAPVAVECRNALPHDASFPSAFSHASGSTAGSAGAGAAGAAPFSGSGTIVSGSSPEAVRPWSR
jgi:hypothetical protein